LGDTKDPEVGTFTSKADGVLKVRYDEIEGKASLFDEGGEVEEGVDLFEDYDDIPSNVQMVLEKYPDAFEDGDYRELEKANKELGKIGYTFEYGLDGQAYDLRKIGEKGKSEYMAKGGEIKKYPKNYKTKSNRGVNPKYNYALLQLNKNGDVLLMGTYTKSETAESQKTFWEKNYAYPQEVNKWVIDELVESKMAEGGIIKPEKPIEKMTKLELMRFVYKIDINKNFYPKTTLAGRVQAKNIYNDYLERKNSKMAMGGKV
jgi:hypothetical protein